MKVEPFENWRFWVTSETRKGVRHLVDLMHEGRPCCSCEDFQIRLEPKFEAGIRVPTEDLCKHCLLCVEWVGKTTKSEIKKQAEMLKKSDFLIGAGMLAIHKLYEQK